MHKPTRTVFVKECLDREICLETFTLLKDHPPFGQWDEGPYSINIRKNQPTRKAKAIDYGAIPMVKLLIDQALEKLDGIWFVNGVYLNYYRDGNDWTPNHSHKDTCQMIISLGGTRTLSVGKKPYPMSNGDVILFGHGMHGVPKEDTQEARISIAVFMVRLE
jgi:hypothetical protein